jgi:hypothetical protein
VTVFTTQEEGKVGDAQFGRRSIGARLRFRVLPRDGFRCRYCGATASDVQLVIDHVWPVVQGGGNEFENLVAACQPCNAGKADLELLPPEEEKLWEYLSQALFYVKRGHFYPASQDTFSWESFLEYATPAEAAAEARLRERNTRQPYKEWGPGELGQD